MINRQEMLDTINTLINRAFLSNALIEPNGINILKAMESHSDSMDEITKEFYFQASLDIFEYNVVNSIVEEKFWKSQKNVLQSQSMFDCDLSIAALDEIFEMVTFAVESLKKLGVLKFVTSSKIQDSRLTLNFLLNLMGITQFLPAQWKNTQEYNFQRDCSIPLYTLRGLHLDLDLKPETVAEIAPLLLFC